MPMGGGGAVPAYQPRQPGVVATHTYTHHCRTTQCIYVAEKPLDAEEEWKNTVNVLKELISHKWIDVECTL